MADTALYSDAVVFLQVILIDIALAGDNAVVVGMAAASVDESIRRKVIVWGISVAVLLRMALATIAVELLQVVGLTLAGGFLLLWVCWKMFSDIASEDADDGGTTLAAHDRHAFGRAVTRIILADLSMSLDNILAVAGAARDNVAALVAGLLISIVLMAVAASCIARLIHRFPAINWIGLTIIFVVALDMIWRGTHTVACAGIAPFVCSLT